MEIVRTAMVHNRKIVTVAALVVYSSIVVFWMAVVYSTPVCDA